MDGEETRPLDRQLITGVNCQPQTVYSDFLTTKHLCRKTGGVLFFHMAQSFPKGGNVDPVTAHAATLELAGFFKGHEVLVCTHIDRAHIHSHFIINSVNLDTGRKQHIAKEQVEELRQCSDQVCLRFGLPVFRQQPCRRKAKSMSTAEYHMADRERSNKARLMYVIRACMRHAADRDTFIALMESQGYQVRWEQNRRSITYTPPAAGGAAAWRRRRHPKISAPPWASPLGPRPSPPKSAGRNSRSQNLPVCLPPRTRYGGRPCEYSPPKVRKIYPKEMKPIAHGYQREP